jgi:hypothetical protein
MAPSEFETLAATLEEVNDSIADQNERLTAQTEAMAAQTKELAEVRATFVPRTRFRWFVAGAVLVLAVLVVIGWRFRVADQARLRDREAVLHQSAVDQHQQLIDGCERGNVLRASLYRTIDRAYTPSPIPDGLPPELRDLFAQSQQHLAAQREAQLSDPGVQPVDCAMAYPAPSLPTDKR